MLKFSGQPEILRAAQRDETFLREMNDSLSSCLQFFQGFHTWVRIRDTVRIVTNLIYYGLTTLSGLQTLGEEYTGIIQIDATGKNLKPASVQMLMVFLNCCGEKYLTDSLKKFERKIEELPAGHSIQPDARVKLIKASEYLRQLLPILQRLHKAIFYFNGHYYNLSKRVTHTRYVLVRQWLKDRSTHSAFKLLGIVSMLSLLLNTANSWTKSSENDSELRSSNKMKFQKMVRGSYVCRICLDSSPYPGATSCGHVFCWDCIIKWLQESGNCPTCNKKIKASRVIFLQNFGIASLT